MPPPGITSTSQLSIEHVPQPDRHSVVAHNVVVAVAPIESMGLTVTTMVPAPLTFPSVEPDASNRPPTPASTFFVMELTPADPTNPFHIDLSQGQQADESILQGLSSDAAVGTATSKIATSPGSPEMATVLAGSFYIYINLPLTNCFS